MSTVRDGLFRLRHTKKATQNPYFVEYKPAVLRFQDSWTFMDRTDFENLGPKMKTGV